MQCTTGPGERCWNVLCWLQLKIAWLLPARVLSCMRTDSYAVKCQEDESCLDNSAIFSNFYAWKYHVLNKWSALVLVDI